MSGASRRAVAALALLACCSIPARRAAAERLPLGGRSASMGGAAAASGRDAAMSFINPAGFGRVPHLTLSLSASLYQYERIHVSDFFLPRALDPTLSSLGGAPAVHGNDIDSSQFSAFPGAAALLWHFGGKEPGTAHQVLSLSAIVVRNRQRAYGGDFSLAFPGDTTLGQSFTSTLFATDYRVGPGYAWRKGPLNFGFSAFMTYVSSTTTENSEVFSGRSDGFLASERSSFARASALGFQPIIGLQVNATPELAFGASFAPPSLHLTGDLEVQGRSKFTQAGGAGDASSTEAYFGDGSSKRVYPMRLRLGVSFERRKSWSMAVDGEVEFAQDGSFEQTLERTTATQEAGLPVDVVRRRESAESGTEQQLRLHFGFERFLNDALALRAGAFYEGSGERLAPTADDLLVLDLTRVGLTGGVGLDTDIADTTIGFELVAGFGKTIAADVFSNVGQTGFVTVDARSYAASLFISGAFDLEGVEKLRSLVTDPGQVFAGKRHVVRLSELGPGLARFENDPQIDVLASGEPVVRFETGDAEVDAFLRRIAEVRATILVGRAVAKQLPFELQQLKTSISEAGADPRPLIAELLRRTEAAVLGGGASGPTPPVAARAERLLGTGLTLRHLLRRLVTDLAWLPRQGAELFESAGEKFKGPKAVQLPAVLRGLGEAQAELTASARDLPGLVQALGEALAAVVSAATPEPIRPESPAPVPAPPPASTLPEPAGPIPPAPAPGAQP